MCTRLYVSVDKCWRKLAKRGPGRSLFVAKIGLAGQKKGCQSCPLPRTIFAAKSGPCYTFSELVQYLITNYTLKVTWKWIADVTHECMHTCEITVIHWNIITDSYYNSTINSETSKCTHALWYSCVSNDNTEPFEYYHLASDIKYLQIFWHTLLFS